MTEIVVPPKDFEKLEAKGKYIRSGLIKPIEYLPKGYKGKYIPGYAYLIDYYNFFQIGVVRPPSKAKSLYSKEGLKKAMKELLKGEYARKKNKC